MARSVAGQGRLSGWSRSTQPPLRRIRDPIQKQHNARLAIQVSEVWLYVTFKGSPVCKCSKVGKVGEARGRGQGSGITRQEPRTQTANRAAVTCLNGALDIYVCGVIQRYIQWR